MINLKKLKEWATDIITRNRQDDAQNQNGTSRYYREKKYKTFYKFMKEGYQQSSH